MHEPVLVNTMTLPTEDDRKAAREWLEKELGSDAMPAFERWSKSLAQFRADAMRVEREANAYIAETAAPPDDTYPVTPYGVDKFTRRMAIHLANFAGTQPMSIMWRLEKMRH